MLYPLLNLLKEFKAVGHSDQICWIHNLRERTSETIPTAWSHHTSSFALIWWRLHTFSTFTVNGDDTANSEAANLYDNNKKKKKKEKANQLQLFPDSRFERLITPKLYLIPLVLLQGERNKKRRHGRVLTVFCGDIHSLSTAGNAGEEFRECDFSAEIKRGWTLTALNSSALRGCSKGLPLKFKGPTGAPLNAPCQ